MFKERVTCTKTKPFLYQGDEALVKTYLHVFLVDLLPRLVTMVRRGGRVLRPQRDTHLYRARCPTTGQDGRATRSGRTNRAALRYKKLRSVKHFVCRQSATKGLF